MKSFTLTFKVLITVALAMQAPMAFSQTNKMEMLPATAFIDLAKKINPTVVNISTSTLPRGRMRGQRDPFLDMLERFYGVPMMPNQGRPQQSLGTGFIIREDGLIVTNNHVIAGADVIKVQINENSKKLFDAKVVGSDERSDIALIKITPDGKLPFAELGSSKDLQVGEWVAAFGNPFGQGHTMTKGIISAKGRDINEINKFPLLQTDTPINPGNSGGPLVNLRGQVIGVNSAIDARAQGIGFAIPIDEVKSILPQLEKDGRIRKAFLGVGLGDLDPMAAAQLGIKDSEGAVVTGVERGSPADRAGIKPYDLIKEFNGKAVKNSMELRDFVGDAKIGSEVSVKVIREGKTRSLTVQLSERRESQKVARKDLPAPKSTKVDRLGFSVAEMNPQMQQRFQIAEEFAGRSVITEVEPDSPAMAAGLQPGDVVLDINRKEVSNAAEVNRQVKKGANTVRIAREDTMFIVVIQSR